MNVSVKIFSISMAERAYRQAREEARRAGVSLSAWMTRAAREKLQRDAAASIAEADRRTGPDWADWAEANSGDFSGPGRADDGDGR